MFSNKVDVNAIFIPNVLHVAILYGTVGINRMSQTGNPGLKRPIQTCILQCQLRSFNYLLFMQV